MNQRIMAVCLLLSLFVSWSVFSQVMVLEIRLADHASWLDCAVISPGDELVYYSINSIYRVPVEEHLRVAEDGTLVPIQVISTSDVMYYYGITTFTQTDEKMVRAVPEPTRYRELRIKVGPVSQQRLALQGRALSLGKVAAEGEVVVVSVKSVARALACR